MKKKQQFKKKVIDWIASEGLYHLIADKKIRVYDSPKYGLEVRIYDEPMEMMNSKRSRRMMAVDENGYNSTFGYHSRKISTYVHINEKDFELPEEKSFILETLKN